jgi:hypothetical protein
MVAQVRPVVGALSTSATIALPSVVAENDILVIHAETEDVTHAPPSGWAQVTGSPLSQTTAPATRHHLWWKRAGPSESNVSHSITGLDHRIAYMYAISGSPTTGDPWDVTATALDNTTDTSGDCPGLTTTEVNTCITCHITTGFDRGTNSSTWHSGWTNSSLQTSSAMVAVNSLVERRDNTNNTGSGGTVGMATGFKPAAGVVDATVVTVVDATTKAMHTVAWKSAVPAIDPTLAEARTENASPFTTQIIAAKAASKLVMAVLVSGTAVATPTVTGLSLTWSLVGSALTVGGTATKLCWYESTQVGGSDVSGQITVTVSTTPTGCSWSIYQLFGMAASGTIVQNPSVSSFLTTQTLTFSAAADALNRPIVAAGVIPQNTGGTITPESGWVEGAEVVRSTPNAKLWSAYQPSSFDTSTSITEDGDYDIGMFGLEINFTAGATTLTGDLAVTESLTGAVVTDKPVSGSSVTTTSLTGAVTSSKPAAGDVPVTTALAGAVSRTANASGASTTTVGLAGAAAREAAAAGTSSTTVGVVGALTADAPLSGDRPTTAALDGSVTSDRPIAGATAIVWAAAGDMVVAREASGTLDVSTGLTGTATATKPVVGVLAAGVDFGGALEVLGSEDFAGHTETTTALSGDLTADRPVSGDLAAAVALGGELTKTVALSGGLSEAVSLAGVVTSDTTAAGSVAVGVGITGDLTVGGAPDIAGTVTTLWDSTGTLLRATTPAGDAQVGVAFTGGLDMVRAGAGTLAAAVALAGALTLEKALTGTLAVSVAKAAALTGADVAGYTPGPPYTLYTAGEPYVSAEPVALGWGDGGWGDGPWGGS